MVRGVSSPYNSYLWVGEVGVGSSSSRYPTHTCRLPDKLGNPNTTFSSAAGPHLRWRCVVKLRSATSGGGCCCRLFMGRISSSIDGLGSIPISRIPLECAKTAVVVLYLSLYARVRNRVVSENLQSTTDTGRGLLLLPL